MLYPYMNYAMLNARPTYSDVHSMNRASAPTIDFTKKTKSDGLKVAAGITLTGLAVAGVVAALTHNTKAAGKIVAESSSVAPGQGLVRRLFTRTPKVTSETQNTTKKGWFKGWFTRTHKPPTTGEAYTITNEDLYSIRDRLPGYSDTHEYSRKFYPKKATPVVTSTQKPTSNTIERNNLDITKIDAMERQANRAEIGNVANPSAIPATITPTSSPIPNGRGDKLLQPPYYDLVYNNQSGFWEIPFVEHTQKPSIFNCMALDAYKRNPFRVKSPEEITRIRWRYKPEPKLTPALTPTASVATSPGIETIANARPKETQKNINRLQQSIAKYRNALSKTSPKSNKRKRLQGLIKTQQQELHNLKAKYGLT